MPSIVMEYLNELERRQDYFRLNYPTMRLFYLILRNAKVLRLLKITFVATLILTLLDSWHAYSALRAPSTKRKELLRNERVFITSIFWNNEDLLRDHWALTVIGLAKSFGRDNVFVSIAESGSWDKTKHVLTGLVNELESIGIPNRVTLDNTTHEQEVNSEPAASGWVWTTRERMELRRIPYLARHRNQALAPLFEMYERGERFDKIVFIGDIVFSVEDVKTLLATNNGEYAAACALDFAKAPYFYDTFAMRDSEGEEMLTTTWPFFRSRKSRHALKANRAVPVKRCWNGMVVFDTAPFYENGLSFRGIPDSLASRHIEGSECCIIHADNQLDEKGVWVNPQVRVGYNAEAYHSVNGPRRWVSFSKRIIGSWQNRILRWSTTTWFKKRIVAWRFANWQREYQEAEPGADCLVNEMQVLTANGWAHV